MRLLQTNIQETCRFRLVEKTPIEMAGLKYAILSHTWEKDEVVFEDISHNTESLKSEASIFKIRKVCEQAVGDGYDYVWIDTICIDKRSSAELSEAINSMFAWYRDAATCYAFMIDAPDNTSTVEAKAEFSKSKWFRRGWTLQELLAPREVTFFSGDWTPIGEKKGLSTLLADTTGIDIEILLGNQPVDSASVARRMSWASKREVTRPEDIAYCLMGIFSVNMPMLYGEGGEKAFLRLQEEIMKGSDDQSLFAWVDLAAPPDARFGLLAPSPSSFLYSNSIIPYQDWEPRSPYAVTNRGLRIDLHLTAREDEDGLFVAALDCPAPPAYEDSTFLAIYLKKLSDSDQQYARVKVGQFAMIRRRGPLQTVYIRQKPHKLLDGGAFPHHLAQLKSLPSPDVYHIVRIMIAKPNSKHAPLPMRTEMKPLVPKWPLVFPILKGANQLAAAIIMQRDDGERVAVLIGSLNSFQIAFDALELDVGEDPATLNLQDMQEAFSPSTSGRVELEYHSVRVSATPVVRSPAKYYMVDIGIEAIKRSVRLSEFMSRAYDVVAGTGYSEVPDKLPVSKTTGLGSMKAAESGGAEKKGEIRQKKSPFFKRLVI
ncbi:HET-domain-containing protein [Biscogniauxia mediterranea]|nr:HET-domain-containing protein [Biscogniauxia mediterranea]